MFRTENSSVRILQAIAAIAGFAVLLWSLGLPSIRFVDAANVTYFSDTISTSATGTAAAHTIQYTIPTGSAGVEPSESIAITFPAQFTGGNTITVDDLDLIIDGVDQTVVDPAAAANQWEWAWAVDTLTFTSGGGTASATENATVTIKIGSSASGGTDRLVNPTATSSYEISLTSGDGANNDTGTTRVAILSTVFVTATVDTTFTFSVEGLGGGVDVNGTTTTGTTTATAIPFGLLQAGVGNATTTAQRLTVTTNAGQGYTVTAQLDGPLDSSTGADIDGFNDTGTPIAWANPAGTLGSEETYGHWAMTSEDSDLDGDAFGTDLWQAASTTPRNVMSHTGPADGTTADIGQTDVGFKIQITSLQEAGDDYDAILTYVATPVF